MIVVYGCGQMGVQLLQELAARGDAVTMVDPDRMALEELSKHFEGRLVQGSGTDEGVLRTAGIEQAECFIAVSFDLNSNIMAAQIAKHLFGVRRVIARIEHPELTSMYRAMGIEVVSPTLQAAKHVGAMIERVS